MNLKENISKFARFSMSLFCLQKIKQFFAKTQKGPRLEILFVV